MKKEDLTQAVHHLRQALRSDEIIESIKIFRKEQSNTTTLPVISNFTSWLVAGISTYELFPETMKWTASLLEMDNIYAPGRYPFWIHYWTEVQQFRHHSNSAQMLSTFLDKPSSVTFMEAHRRVVCLDNLLQKTIQPSRSEDELIVEGLSIEVDPTVKDVEIVLRTLRELAQDYCSVLYPDEVITVRVSYLDLGSNYQVGIKVDGKAEVGPNLSKFLTQIVKFLINPKAYIRSLNSEVLIQEVDAFTDIQARIDRGEITLEAGKMFTERLLSGARTLNEQQVFPASLLKEREVRAPASELLELMQHQPVHRELTGPSLRALLPPTQDPSR